MNKQLANSPDAVAPGPNEGAGAGRGSPEEEPQNAPPQAPAAMARLPRSLSNDPKTFPSEEAKPNDFDRTKVGICKLSSTPVQANSTVRRESGESFPYKHAAGAGAAGQAAIPPCKIPALQSTDGDATLNLGKGSLEQNNAKGAWVTLSQSTVVLGTDGNTSVLPGRVEGVRASSPGFSAPGNKGLRDARPSAPARGAVGSRSGMGQELGREGTLPVLSREPAEALVLRRGVGVRSCLCLSRQKSGAKSPPLQQQSLSPGHRPRPGAAHCRGCPPGRQRRAEPCALRPRRSQLGGGQRGCQSPPIPGLQQTFSFPREQPEEGGTTEKPNFSGRCGCRGGCPWCGSAMLVCKRSSCPIFFFFSFFPPFPPFRKTM